MKSTIRLTTPEERIYHSTGIPQPAEARLEYEGQVFVEAFPSTNKAREWRDMMKDTCARPELLARIPDLAVFARNLAEHVRESSMTRFHWAEPHYAVDWGAGNMDRNDAHTAHLADLLREPPVRR